MRRAVLLGVAVLALVAAGVRLLRDPAPDPAPFVVAVAGELLSNRYGEAWDDLVPGQQRLVARDAFVRCESASPVPGRLESVRAVSTTREGVDVPGVGAAASVAVRVHAVVAVGGRRIPVEHVIHAVRAGGRWGWYLAADRYRDYLGGCGGAPA